MSLRQPLNGLFIATVVVATVAVSLTAYTFRAASDSHRVHSSRSATLRELAALRDEAMAMQSGIKLFQATAGEPADVEKAAKTILPDAGAALSNLPDQPLFDGWTLRSVEISIASIAPGDAGRLVEYLENQLPPWRLAAFQFNALSTERGTAKLTMQTIARASR